MMARHAERRASERAEDRDSLKRIIEAAADLAAQWRKMCETEERKTHAQPDQDASPHRPQAGGFLHGSGPVLDAPALAASQ
jgi:hypothetical protein